MDVFFFEFDQIRNHLEQKFSIVLNDFLIHQQEDELHVNVLYQHDDHQPNDVHFQLFEIVD